MSVGDGPRECGSCGRRGVLLTRTIIYTSDMPGLYDVDTGDVCEDCRPEHERRLTLTREFRRTRKAHATPR